MWNFSRDSNSWPHAPAEPQLEAGIVSDFLDLEDERTNYIDAIDQIEKPAQGYMCHGCISVTHDRNQKLRILQVTNFVISQFQRLHTVLNDG